MATDEARPEVSITRQKSGRGSLPYLRVFIGLLAIPPLLLGINQLRYELRGHALLTRFIDPQANGPLLRFETNAVSTEDVLVETNEGSVSGRLYLPAGIAKPHGIVVLPGIHHLGIYDPRLVNFSRALAGGGFAVVMIDFHGTPGYGQAFTDSIQRDWGGKPLVDLQKGLAAALERYPWLDGERVCALGASYGGFMMNWIEGNWPDRFRCIVSHDGVLDQRMMYYATEELWFPEWEMGGTYYDAPQLYEKFNPINFVSKWRTPMLVIHGEQDFRIPYSQGLGVFSALQRRGIESRLLVFPNENHWVLKPADSIQWHHAVFDWLDAHLKN